MGVYYSVYVGPYFECHTHLDTKAKRTSCSNSACKKFTESVYDKSKKFCSVFGSVIREVEYTTQSPAVDYWDIVEGSKESLSWHRDEENYNGLKHVFISNRDLSSMISRSFHYDINPQIIEITARDMERECKVFEELLSKELALLKEKYDSVKLTWGVLIEAN